jgi:hypothetical protein
MAAFTFCSLPTDFLRDAKWLIRVDEMLYYSHQGDECKIEVG